MLIGGIGTAAHLIIGIIPVTHITTTAMDIIHGITVVIMAVIMAVIMGDIMPATILTIHYGVEAGVIIMRTILNTGAHTQDLEIIPVNAVYGQVLSALGMEDQGTTVHILPEVVMEELLKSI